MGFINRDTFLQLLHHSVVTRQPTQHTLLNLAKVADNEGMAGAWYNHLSQIHTEHGNSRQVLDIEPGITAPSPCVSAEVFEPIGECAIRANAVLHRNQFLVQRVGLAVISHSADPRIFIAVFFFPGSTIV